MVVDPPRDVQPIFKVKPIFPDRLKRLGGGPVKGRVKVRVTVSKEGLVVGNVEILNSEPKRPQDKQGPFDKYAIDAVKQFRFEPYRNSFLVDQEFIFTVEND